MIDGFVAPRFERVRDAFARNFEEGLETGAAFSACRDGEVLVDLWGGEAATGRAWSADDLQLIFSGTKGITAICLLILMDRGRIDLDAPVRTYWPAFGKPEILVRHIMSHTSRLPGFTEPVSWQDMLDDQLMARRLEAQSPFSDPRCALTYHPVTYGWLCGELLRQVDGRSIGRFLAEELAGPHELDLWIGLPASEERRVTTLHGDGVWGHVSASTIEPTPRQFATDPVFSAIWYNPPLFGPDFGKWNARDLHATEMPGANAIGTARSVARLYSRLAAGRLVRRDTLASATTTLADQVDILGGDHRRYGAGFSLQVAEKMQFGPRLDGFGHGGAGGSVHGAWPSDGIGFSYAMNRLIDGNDPRAARLLAALAAALA